jgi:16S rRNA (cytosine967-C5)-methyltransferase
MHPLKALSHRSKIAGDPFDFPIAVADRVRPLRPMEFLGLLVRFALDFSASGLRLGERSRGRWDLGSHNNSLRWPVSRHRFAVSDTRYVVQQRVLCHGQAPSESSRERQDARWLVENTLHISVFLVFLDSRGRIIRAVPGRRSRNHILRMTSALSEAVALHPPGFASRRAAASLLDAVLRRNRPLDEQLDDRHPNPSLRELCERDRAFARRIVATALRRLGTLRHLIGDLLDRGLPKDGPQVEIALLVGAAQLLFLDVPQHAAVDLSVRLVQGDPRHARYAGLVNAVMRRIARAGVEPLAALAPLHLDTPDWLFTRWTNAYGADAARAISLAHSLEPPLDVTVKSDPDRWAERLGARKLPTDSVRLAAHGPISALPGYSEGEWWIQDAAAALPARLFGEVRARSVLDLCAAPGGKTAQLASFGAIVTAVDRSASRMARLRENLTRTGLQAVTVVANVEDWRPDPATTTFDAVLIDAPCTSTGTIRRHPDIPWRKAPGDIAIMTALQRRLLTRAIDLTRSGGTITYCTCSLEPEEGEGIVSAVVEQDRRVRRKPITAAEFPALEEFITPLGELRTLPCHWPDPDPRMYGLDGFFAARLERG